MISSDSVPSFNWTGIDVSKDTLAIYHSATQTACECSNDSAGISQLLEQLSAQSNVAVVCEATGGYEAMMAIALHQQGIRISVVNPRPVRNLAKAMSQIAKTDAMFRYVAARKVVRPARNNAERSRSCRSALLILQFARLNHLLPMTRA